MLSHYIQCDGDVAGILYSYMQDCMYVDMAQICYVLRLASIFLYACYMVTESSPVRFQFWSCIPVRQGMLRNQVLPCIRKVQRTLFIRPRPIGKAPSNRSINTNITFSRTSIFCRYFLPSPSSPRVWLIFAVLRCKTVVSPPRKRGNLCCFARKAIVRRHESTTNILVLRGDFACQHYWRLRWG